MIDGKANLQSWIEWRLTGQNGRTGTQAVTETGTSSEQRQWRRSRQALIDSARARALNDPARKEGQTDDLIGSFSHAWCHSSNLIGPPLDGGTAPYVTDKPFTEQLLTITEQLLNIFF